ncbi:crotonase/enoyl-CoA hydratase family protein [Streptosporangium carneum]|uniref:enoyl-CoA hydratase n=1 Tax=Streptosporangium carneum TaxID=47481 RepID=A0A9W6IC14_9ACTN|nr:crotonase/enoyl-CoA hydratase family protein [Streptosporangium carneum]GLK14720.1 enoyl-CoA hydratase [Streptosporangium carneum]
MTVKLAVDGAVATVTVDRPEKLNALDYATIDRLSAALDRIEGDDAVRAVILTGAGERAFSAGADIGDLARSIAGGTDRALREIVRRGQGLTRRVEEFPKPVVAAVNGLAYGGGCEIVEAAHLAVASEHAAFAKPEITLGFPPPFGGSQRLPRHIGRKRGLEMILTGDPIDAARAAELGIVNAVVPHGDLLAAARRLAGRVIRHAPTAVGACLAAVTRGLNVPIDEGLAVEASWFAVTVPTEGVAQGLSRFLDRERPSGQETRPRRGTASSRERV